MNIEQYDKDPRVRRNLIGFALLTLIILYFVIFTLVQGYGIEWYAVIGFLVYCVAGWLLLVPDKTPATEKATKAT